MITALQHFISRKGKIVFIALLLLVIVSFVLYLSQGSSVFDLMSDGGREKKEFYGYDWNNPDQRRFLNVTTRAVGALGFITSPGQDVVGEADDSYIQGLQQQIQAALRANPEEVDRDALQRMFQYMQAWPNFSRDFKVREIARAGAYDPDFLEQSIKSRITLEGQANAWSFLPADVNHPSINSQFIQFLANINPALESEDNRTAALLSVGSRFGMSANELETLLYASFRDFQVDEIYSHRGYALPNEVDILSHQNAFAWDGEVAVISMDNDPNARVAWGDMKINSIPKAGDSVLFSLGARKIEFLFGEPVEDENRSVFSVPIGSDPEQSARNLTNAINTNNIGLEASVKKNALIHLALKLQSLPKSLPAFSTRAETFSFNDQLSASLADFYEGNKDLEAFMEAPRTFSTALVFSSEKFINQPSAPDEVRLRSYFERNRLDFLPDSKEENNETFIPEVTFEDVADQVKELVTKQDLVDAKREADRLAQNAALDFLDQLNSLSDRLRGNYPDFTSLRNSNELNELLTESGAEQRKISFSNKDMNIQAMVLGLEKRASEKKSNKEALEEVDSLNESKFFTRSVRKSRNGHVVFLLDRKIGEHPSSYSDIPFSTLCREYTNDKRRSQFSQKVDKIKDKLLSKGKATDANLRKYQFEAKNEMSARASFDSKRRSLRTKIDELENSRTEKSNDRKSSSESLEKELKQLRDQLTQLNEERTAIFEVLEVAETLEVDGKWIELERNEDQAIFAVLNKVYSIRGKQFEKEQKNSLHANLERSRGMLSRDQTIEELLALTFAEE